MSLAFILFDHDSPETLAHLGGAKALRLQQLARSGADVPPWFCISVTAPERFVRGYALIDWLESFSHQVFFDDAQFAPAADAFAQEVEKRFLGCSMSPEIAKEILSNRSALGAKDQSVAVRISRRAEESGERGPVFLNEVSDFELIYDVRRVWAAAYSSTSLAGRRRLGLPLAPSHVGVIIQKTILEDLGGGAFLTDQGASFKVEVRTGDSALVVPYMARIEQIARQLARLTQGPVEFAWAVEAGRLWFLG